MQGVKRPTPFAKLCLQTMSCSTHSTWQFWFNPYILFHPFHISTLKVGLIYIYIYIYKPHFQGGDVEWVEQDVWIKPKLPCGMGGTRHSLQTEFSKRGRSFDTLHASNLATWLEESLVTWQYGWLSLVERQPNPQKTKQPYSTYST